METFSADAAKAYAVLELSRRVVGVKFAYDRAEFDRFAAVELTAELAYCVMVKCAMGGASLKMTRETSGCGGSSRAFGFVPPTEGYYDGGAYCALGWLRTYAKLDPDRPLSYDAWGRSLGLPSVRGLVVGRALLYPPDDDVAAAVDTAVGLVH